MANQFAIGIYQSPGTIAFAGPPSNPPTARQIIPGVVVTDPYTLAWYAVRDPFAAQHTPPQVIGTDLGGAPSVRGYSRMVWQYNHMRPEFWYAFYRLWRLSRMPAGPHTGKVLIQWPDPETGTVVTASARWDSIGKASRVFATFEGVEFAFSHISIDDPAPVTGTWRAIP